MIEITVGTLWKGQVGVRDKYLKICSLRKQGLRIHHKGEFMDVTFEELKEKIRGKSKVAFNDKFSNKKHYLYYFWWRPPKPEAEKVPETANLFA